MRRDVNDSVIQPNNSKEKKTNRNLAIVVGIIGLGSFALFYVLFIAIMIMRPGLMFNLMPTPTITDAAISDGNRTYLVYQKIDMSKVAPGQKSQPEIKHFISIIVGSKLGASQEIPPYAYAVGVNNRLLFLNKGTYRIYDGSQWVDERSDAIGTDPRGLLTPEGLYVLSGRDSGPHLSLIKSGTGVDMSLPADYLAGFKKDQCACAKLAWYQGRLCLFWSSNESISWTILDGATWSPVATSPFSGGYEVISDNKNLYFFHREGDGPDRHLRYYVYTNDSWSGPMRLPIQGEFGDWDVFIQQGKLKVFVQQFTTQTLYTIDKGTILDPLTLESPFSPSGIMGSMILPFAITTALLFLAVFGLSLLINRYKTRIWEENGTTYEFAGLFRRFLAMMVDNLVLLVPPAIIIALLMHGMEDISGKPLRLILMVFSAFALFFVGGFLYHSLLEGLYGQTLGKKICSIRVLNADFSSCRLSAGFLRNLLRIVDAFFYYLVAVISLAGTLKWQRIGDLVAETVVVKETS